MLPARVYSGMPAVPPDRPANLARRLLPLVVLVTVAVLAYANFGRDGLSLEALVRHRATIDGLVTDHWLLAVLLFTGSYIIAVALSVPGASFLTMAGGFLFGVAIGACAAVVGATIGATLIFLIARTALGKPLLRRAGPRALNLAHSFRADAFSYLLFLRLVPIFPFFLVNLVPAFAGMRLAPFVAATALGIIPGAFVYALAGTGLDSVIAAQGDAYRDCVSSGHSECRLSFDAEDVLTTELIAALVALGLLALVPVAVKRLRRRAQAAE